MDGDDCARPPATSIVQQGRRKSRLPIMGMDDVRDEAWHEALADAGGDLSERGKPERVVRPVPTIGPYIGVAWPSIKMGGVKHEEIETVRLSGEQLRRASQQVRKGLDRVGLAEHGENGWISRD